MSLILEKTYKDPIAQLLYEKFKEDKANGSGIGDDLRARAEAILAQHEANAANYAQSFDEPDPYPFQEIPQGTTVRDLADGGRLFLFADGANLVSTGTAYHYVTADGQCAQLDQDGHQLRAPGGKVFNIQDQAQDTTHTVANIEGLPTHIIPTDLGGNRYRVQLPSLATLTVAYDQGLITIVNPNGTLAVLGPERFEGIAGENVQTRKVGGDAIGFETDANFQGMMSPDGILYLTTPTGLDLVFNLAQPDDQEPQELNGPQPAPFLGPCESMHV